MLRMTLKMLRQKQVSLCAHLYYQTIEHFNLFSAEDFFSDKIVANINHKICGIRFLMIYYGLQQRDFNRGGYI